MVEATLSRAVVKDSPKVVAIAIAGEVDTDIDKADRYFHESLEAEKPVHVLLDLSELTFASSPFFGSLLFWKETVEKSGGKLLLFGVRPEVSFVMHVCSLDRVLMIRSDRAAALAALEK